MTKRKTKVFVGMMRPQWKIPVAAVVCSCGAILKFQLEAREHWQSGHWDAPVYQTIVTPIKPSKKK